MAQHPILPATDEEVTYLTELVRERDQATTIYPADDEFFCTRCDELLPKLLLRLSNAEDQRAM